MTKVDATIPAQKTQMRDFKCLEMNGDKKQISDAKGKPKQIGQFVGLATGCCCCLPMHYNKQKPFDDKKQERA
jgi:peroxiredoxin